MQAATVSQVATALTLRPPGDGDYAFIRSSWRESHNVNGSGPKMSWRAWKATHGQDMDDLLRRPDVAVLLLVPEDDPRTIIGWICWSPGRIPALHYVYVRPQHRTRGVGRALFAATGMGDRLIYTFRGPRRRRDPATVDVVLAQQALRRGLVASFVDAREFLR